MFTHFKITHILGESKMVPINDYSIGEVISIAAFYDNAQNYEIERVR